MDPKIDATDKRIIRLLQNDGKMKIKDIASELSMTNTPIFERIKRLEKAGIIKGYSTIVDREKLGLHLAAFCSVTLESHHLEYIDQFVEDIKNIPEVVEGYHIGGMFDYLLKIYVEDMNAYQKFITQKLATLRNIGRVQSLFVMDVIKREQVLPFDL